jgi:hypothetical protein
MDLLLPPFRPTFSIDRDNYHLRRSVTALLPTCRKNEELIPIKTDDLACTLDVNPLPISVVGAVHLGSM